MNEFHQSASYKPRSSDYQLLPFRFTELNDDSYVLTNLAGEYLVLGRYVVPKLINHQLSTDDPAYVQLRASSGNGELSWRAKW